MKIPENLILPTPYDRLRSEVEQRTSFSLNHCELNIFETQRRAENVKLTFGGFTITSMLRGKKVLQEQGQTVLKDYLPGESYILRPDSEMVINFPEANSLNPTQCTALVIEQGYLQKQLEYINDMFPRENGMGQAWQLNFDSLWLQNDENIAALSSRLIRIFSGTDPLKDILVDLKLKELMLSILRLQNLSAMCSPLPAPNAVNERFRAVAEYIRRNITSTIQAGELSKMACMSKSVFYRAFTNEFGVPPTRLVLIEKIKYAKSMLATRQMKIKDICYALGFTDPNYFTRAFKKIEGITPGQYMQQLKGS